MTKTEIDNFLNSVQTKRGVLIFMNNKLYYGYLDDDTRSRDTQILIFWYWFEYNGNNETLTDREDDPIKELIRDNETQLFYDMQPYWALRTKREININDIANISIAPIELAFSLSQKFVQKGYSHSEVMKRINNQLKK